MVFFHSGVNGNQIQSISKNDMAVLSDSPNFQHLWEFNFIELLNKILLLDMYYLRLIIFLQMIDAWNMHILVVIV